ncbi:MAG: hypothetical protein J2P38_02290, partial [Candidatus Dormibacteraeota bacterium]|nr:hypothetical protein [Candidatus Dormibacteraeota bacterium]
MSQPRIEHEVRRMVEEFPQPARGLADRVLASVPEERGGRHLGWAAVAAMVVAVLIVLTLVYGARG